MFLTLLIVTFFIALSVSFIVAKLFENSISKILSRIVKDEISTAWERYLKFAIIVVGLSGGVRIWELERYINPRIDKEYYLILNIERWILEVYRTIIGTFAKFSLVIIGLLSCCINSLCNNKRTGSKTRKNTELNPSKI